MDSCPPILAINCISCKNSVHFEIIKCHVNINQRVFGIRNRPTPNFHGKTDLAFPQDPGKFKLHGFCEYKVMEKIIGLQKNNNNKGLLVRKINESQK
jgi:hypothetical protein